MAMARTSRHPTARPMPRYSVELDAGVVPAAPCAALDCLAFNRSLPEAPYNSDTQAFAAPRRERESTRGAIIVVLSRFRIANLHSIDLSAMHPKYRGTIAGIFRS